MSILYHIPTSTLIKELLQRVKEGSVQATISVSPAQWAALATIAKSKANEIEDFPYPPLPKE